MSYKEMPHPHQSDLLDTIPSDYKPFVKDVDGEKKFGVLKSTEKGIKTFYQTARPKLGGYISKKENIYGSPTYCPNASRQHKNHMEKYGEMPHLVFFDSETTAIKMGFRKCKICI